MKPLNLIMVAVDYDRNHCHTVIHYLWSVCSGNIHDVTPVVILKTCIIIIIKFPRLPNLFNICYSQFFNAACNIEKLGIGPGNEATCIYMSISSAQENLRVTILSCGNYKHKPEVYT